jgi:phosphoserine phosphatase
MKHYNVLFTFSILFILLLLSGCQFNPTNFFPEPQSDKIAKPKSRYLYIDGFTNNLNQELRNFISATANYNERKIAVFSVDGALINQTPYYASDEATYFYAKNNPDWKPELIDKISKENNFSKKYIEDKTLYWSGLYTDQVESVGNEVLRKHYAFFPEMYDFLANLKTNNFEIWIITSSPEVLYQKFLSDYLNIPENRIIGTKTVINNNKLTNKLIPPFLNKQGKVEAIETFIKAKPLIVVGHSYSDIDMIDSAKNIKIIVNPDNKIKHKSLGNKRVDEYAVKNNWTILDLKDVPTKRSEGMVSGAFNIKQNDAIDV